MSLVSNFPVTTTRALVISGLARCRSVNIFQNSGPGNVYYQFVDHIPNVGGSSSNLTTGNGTLLPASALSAPVNVSVQPNYASTYPGINPSSPAVSDDSDGFDLWVISNSTATISVQTVPF
jgi:hypothetical protein